MDLNDEFAFRQPLALARAESPLTHHHLAANFGSQYEAIQNSLSTNIARMQNLQINRQRIPQNNFHNNLLSPHSNTSPRNSISPITSGYNSAHNSFNSSGSMDSQMGLFQPSQNGLFDRDALLAETNVLFDDEKTPTLLDVKV